MLSSVSPVITGAAAASPHPTNPSSASMRTSTLSARRTSSPAMMTGLSIGRLTAIGSIVLICTGAPRNDLLLDLRNSGRVDDFLELADFLGHARPGILGALRTHRETRLVQFFLHLRRVEHFQQI